MKLSVKNLKMAVDRLKQFHKRYVSCFHTRTRSIAGQSIQYLQGQLLERGRGNMTKYAKNVPDCNNQSLQHFISDSPWDERPVIDNIQIDVSRLIGDEINGSIHIDETCFPKQGRDSVGVKRQYCGRLGKVDNCQVGVFLGYTNGNYRTLIDERLYLPEDWAEDQKRREKCGVPEDVGFKTKAELGWGMVLNAKQNGVPFGWVGMDCFYGEQPWLLDKIDGEGMIYIADIPCDTRVWLNRPRTEVPERKGDRGRIPIREKLAVGEPEPIEVRELADRLDPSQWQHVFLRDTERKELWSNLACLRVCPVRNGLPGKDAWLIIRKDDGEKRTKYQLSNVPVDTTVERMGQMSCSRYWIERALEDAKGNTGLGDYQVRNWMGWHHHMTMTMLAMLFILSLQDEWVGEAPLLSVHDVKEVLEVILTRREITEEEILNILRQKHKARGSARRSHHRRNGR